MSSRRIAVIMACHNRKESTLTCLRALDEAKHRCSSSIEVHTYLLDDASTDGTARAVNAEFPDIQILEGDGNLFWNRGMHKAFSVAINEGYDYYLWLNDDSILFENAIKVLLHTANQLETSGNSCSIIGGAMKDPETGKTTYAATTRHRTHYGRVKISRIPPSSDHPIQCDAVNGNCVLISANVAKKVGNLDPVYQHRWGDYDYCFRALTHGCSVWLAPGYLGTCKRNATEGTWHDVSLPMFTRFRKLNNPHAFPFREYLIYMRRHRGPWWPAHLVWPYLKIIWQSITHQQR